MKKMTICIPTMSVPTFNLFKMYVRSGDYIHIFSIPHTETSLIVYFYVSRYNLLFQSIAVNDGSLVYSLKNVAPKHNSMLRKIELTISNSRKKCEMLIKTMGKITAPT